MRLPGSALSLLLLPGLAVADTRPLKVDDVFAALIEVLDQN